MTKQLPVVSDVYRAIRDPRGEFVRWRAFTEFRREYGAAVSYVPPDVGRRGTMLIVNPLDNWVAAVLQEGFFIKAAQLAGYDVAVVTNHGAWTNRYHTLFGVRRFLNLDAVISRARRDVDAHAADRLLEGVRTFRELMDLKYRDVHVGQFVSSTFVRKRYDGNVDPMDPESRRMLRALLTDSLAYVHAATAVFDAVRPTAALFMERGYSPYGEFFDTAIARGIHPVQWCGSHRENAFMLKRYHAENIGEHPAALSASTWTALERMSWSPALGARVREEIATQYRTRQWFSEVGVQFFTQERDPRRVQELLGFDPRKKTVMVFSHLFWDGTFFWGEDLFMNYREWFIETVRVACWNDRVNWVLKLHPGNVVKLNRVDYRGELVEYGAIRDAVGDLPAHVRVLKPETPFSTWSLLGAIDYAVTVRGTVGIEAALFGAPVLTAGTGRYDRHGFTVDSANREEYLQRLAHIEDTPRLTLKQIELAEKFAYGTFIARPIPFFSITNHHRRDRRATLEVTYGIREPEELLRAHDLRMCGAWIADGGFEDLLNFVAPAFDRDVMGATVSA